MNTYLKGIVSAFAAQVLWGLFPIYWKFLAGVHSLEVLSQRNIWCAVFLGLLVLAVKSRRDIVWQVFKIKAELLWHVFSASLIAINWLVYIWAVNNNHVVDASLGYFLSPLVSVVLGFVVFAERLSAVQWLAAALAAVGVLIMTVASGVFPWIGLTLAATFGIYGMARKKATTGPINGLFVETFLLLPPTLIALGWLSSQGYLIYEKPFEQVELLLAFGGVITAVPLVLYAQGARALPLNLSGLLVFITPTIQFLIGWLVYQEPIALSGWIGYACIWSALIIYCVVLVRRPQSQVRKAL
ncbi:MAG: EamA family transporter RarD [Granulosicoccus sp.]